MNQIYESNDLGIKSSNLVVDKLFTERENVVLVDAAVDVGHLALRRLRTPFAQVASLGAHLTVAPIMLGQFADDLHRIYDVLITLILVKTGRRIVV